MKQFTIQSIKVFVFTLLLSITANSTFAQLRFGTRAGVNLSKMSGAGLSGFSVKALPTYHIGGVAEYSVNNVFAIESGLFLCGKGTNAELSFFGADMSAKITTHYIEIPTNAIVKIDLGKAKLQLFAGPYLSVGLAGKTAISVGNDTETETVKFGSDSSSTLKRTDLGINIGAGLEFNNIVGRLQYGHGLANISPIGGSENELKNNSISISVGYMFGRK